MAVPVHRIYPVTLLLPDARNAAIEVNRSTHAVSVGPDEPVDALITKAFRKIGQLARPLGAEALPVAVLDNTEGSPTLDFAYCEQDGGFHRDPEPDPATKRKAEARFNKWKRTVEQFDPAAVAAADVDEEFDALMETSQWDALPMTAEEAQEPTAGQWAGLSPAVDAKAAAEVCKGQDDPLAVPQAKARLRVHAPLAAAPVARAIGIRTPEDVLPPEPELYGEPEDEPEDEAPARRSTTFTVPERQIEDDIKDKARQGVQGWLNNFGLSLEPGEPEKQMLRDIDTILEGWKGPKVLAVGNPKGGVGKSTVLLEAMSTLTTFSPISAVVADFNEAVGNSDERAGVRGHATGTVRDLARWAETLGRTPTPAEVQEFANAHPRDRYHHVRAHQPQGRGDRMRGLDVDSVLGALSPTYNLIGADTGNSMDAETWEEVMTNAHQLLVPVSSKAASTGAARMFNLLINVWGGAAVDLARNAIVVVTVPNAGMRASEIKALEAAWKDEVRAVVRLPYDRHLGNNNLHFGGARTRTQRALVSLGAEITRGLQGA